MIDIFVNETVLWLFATAVIFTVVGWFMGKTSNLKDVIAATIDSLIDDGYLKTRGTGANMEILKWHEWEKENE